MELTIRLDLAMLDKLYTTFVVMFLSLYFLYWGVWELNQFRKRRQRRRREMVSIAHLRQYQLNDFVEGNIVEDLF